MRRSPSALLRACTAALGWALAWAGWRVLRAGHWSEVFSERRMEHARYWARRREVPGELMYVAIGDSTAQGIGASDPSGSYVGQLATALGSPLRVVNLSISGARLSDIITTLLPRFEELDTTDALVTFAAGANNIESFDPDRFRTELAQILDALPSHALVAEIPSFYLERYNAAVREANAIVYALAQERGLTVVDLYRATGRLGLLALVRHHAPDLFHPNDRGYRVWTRAFLPAAQARLAEITAH